MSTSRQSSLIFLWASLGFSVLLACWVEHRVFWDALALNDDVRNQVYWMARIGDPTLYSNDLIASYFTQPSLISPVVHWIYQAASHWIDPLRLTQFLPFALIVCATFFLFKFTERVYNSRYAFWVCWLFNNFIWTVRYFAGGLPRAFCYPLLFLFLWQYQRQSVIGITLALCLSSLIYTPIALLGVILLFYNAWSMHHRQQGIQLPNSIWLGVVSSIAVGLLRFTRINQGSASGVNFGSLNTLWSALQIQELFPGGRIPLFVFPSFGNNMPWKFLQLPFQMIPHIYLLIPILALIGVWIGYQKYFKDRFGALFVPLSIWQFTIVSIVIYIAAWLSLFYLYVPERYLQFTLPLTIMFVLAAIGYQCQQTWNSLKASILLFITPLIITSFIWQPDLIRLSKHSQALMQFIQTTPKQTVFATNLGLASNIPAFAKRSVLISHEGYIPFHRHYFSTMKQRLQDWLLGYYATDPSTLIAFLQRYKVDYIIVDRNDFQEKRLSKLNTIYYHAFPPRFFKQLQANPQKSYILLDLAKKYAVYHHREYWVIPTTSLKAALTPPIQIQQ